MDITIALSLVTSLTSIVVIIIALGKWQGTMNQKIEALYEAKHDQQLEITALLAKYDAAIAVLTNIQISIAKNTATLVAAFSNIERIVLQHEKKLDELRS